MALIRKAAAGSDSFGHVWPEDGAVVEIDDAEQIAALMAIADAGFSEVTPSGEHAEFSEIDPKVEDSEAPKPAAKKTAARKTTASKPE